MSYVEVRRLSKSFGPTSVFRDISLDVDRGSMCVLVGPSGCGKTTLLRAIAGLATPDAGSIKVDGRDITRADARSRSIGMVFQHYALFPNMSVEQNLAFGLEQQKLAAAHITKKVKDMVALMGLEERAKALPAALSGGQKQRVALARALITEPKLLLLDEPLSALDAQIRKRLRVEFKRLQRAIGFTAIFVTHDQEEALLLGDKVAIMQKGEFAQVGSPAEIYNTPANLEVARFIGDFNILEPQAAQRLFGSTTALFSAVRPEAIRIAEASKKHKANGITIGAEIEQMQILGATVRYLAKCGDDRLKVDTLNSAEAVLLNAGSKVTLSIDKKQIHQLRP
jgi:putative spermidine/putrescine transport system ATP-binding protein